MWINKVCFEAEESVTMPGKYMVVPVHENFHLNHTTGSYNIIAARVMNLSYAQYLRFCRDIVGAEIVGKGTMYPVPYFKQNGTFYQFVKLLNNRANLILWEREHPNWQQHREELAEWEKMNNVSNK